MKKKDFVTQDLLSKIYQHNDPGPRKLPPERRLAEEYGVPLGAGKTRRHRRHTHRAGLGDLDKRADEQQSAGL